jgi:hypothetical protein
VRQPDDPGLDPLDEPHPFDPDPFAGLRNSLAIKVYLFLIVLVIIGTAVAYVVRA